MNSSFCHRLPKLELHAHLNGSLSEATLKELYDINRKKYPSEINSSEFSSFLQDSYTLSSFFDLFKLTYNLTSTPETVQIATERVIEDFHNENVVYLELRSTLRNEATMTKQEYLESMIKGVLNCKSKFPNISVKIIVSVNRKDLLESIEANLKLAIEYFKRYPEIIVGVDTSGDPTTNKFSNLIGILENARNEGLKITVHCAEVVGNDEIKDILEFHPDRLGHGTCIHESFGGSASNWNLLLKKRIPVELCISSNIKCHTVNSVENHHFKLLYNAKHPITLSTDDKGVFKTTLTKEFQIIQQAFNLSDEELWRLSYSSIDYIFADSKEKESLRTILNQWKIGNL